MEHVVEPEDIQIFFDKLNNLNSPKINHEIKQNNNMLFNIISNKKKTNLKNYRSIHFFKLKK